MDPSIASILFPPFMSRLLFILFLAVSFSCINIAHVKAYVAGEVKLMPMPEDNEFIVETSKTKDILKALFFEHRQKYKQANRIWQKMPSDKKSVKEHVFRTDLALSSFGTLPHSPKSETSLLLLSRYYSWHKAWAKALSVLEKYKDEIDFSHEAYMEMVRLYLCLRQYDKAQSVLVKLCPANRREKMQQEIMTIWLGLLSGNRGDVLQKLETMEEDFLYISFLSIFPEEILSSKSDLKHKLKQSFIRYPSDDEIFEQLIQVLIFLEEWNELQELLSSQRTIFNMQPVWSVLAEMYLKTGQYNKLDKLIESKARRKKNPLVYDLIARKAILNKNWKLLKNISGIYQAAFPELLDGKLYRAEYYRLTGQMQKSDMILAEIGLLGKQR